MLNPTVILFIQAKHSYSVIHLKEPSRSQFRSKFKITRSSKLLKSDVEQNTLSCCKACKCNFYSKINEDRYCILFSIISCLTKATKYEESVSQHK